jgi:hypothetical protein
VAKLTTKYSGDYAEPTVLPAVMHKPHVKVTDIDKVAQVRKVKNSKKNSVQETEQLHLQQQPSATLAPDKHAPSVPVRVRKSDAKATSIDEKKKMSDVEILAQLREIVEKGNPYDKYTILEQIGVGCVNFFGFLKFFLLIF